MRHTLDKTGTHCAARVDGKVQVGEVVGRTTQGPILRFPGQRPRPVRWANLVTCQNENPSRRPRLSPNELALAQDGASPTYPRSANPDHQMITPDRLAAAARLTQYAKGVGLRGRVAPRDVLGQVSFFYQVGPDDKPLKISSLGRTFSEARERIDQFGIQLDSGLPLEKRNDRREGLGDSEAHILRVGGDLWVVRLAKTAASHPEQAQTRARMAIRQAASTGIIQASDLARLSLVDQFRDADQNWVFHYKLST